MSVKNFPHYVKNGILRMFAHSPKLVVLVYVSSFIPNIDKVVIIVQILFFSYILLVAVLCTYIYKLLHQYHIFIAQYKQHFAQFCIRLLKV